MMRNFRALYSYVTGTKSASRLAPARLPQASRAQILLDRSPSGRSSELPAPQSAFTPSTTAFRGRPARYLARRTSSLPRGGAAAPASRALLRRGRCAFGSHHVGRASAKGSRASVGPGAARRGACLGLFLKRRMAIRLNRPDRPCSRALSDEITSCLLPPAAVQGHLADAAGRRKPWATRPRALCTGSSRSKAGPLPRGAVARARPPSRPGAIGAVRATTAAGVVRAGADSKKVPPLPSPSERAAARITSGTGHWRNKAKGKRRWFRGTDRPPPAASAGRARAGSASAERRGARGPAACRARRFPCRPGATTRHPRGAA
jgi:hypothetical protein